MTDQGGAAMGAMRLCARCNRPLVEHDAEGACPDMGVAAMSAPAEVTAETVTDEQIREYEIAHDSAAHRGVVLAATSEIPSLRKLGRQRVAAAINARAKAKAVQPVEATAESLGDMDFIDFSSKLRTEMDHLDGADWQAAEDLRQDCRIARIYNNADARKRVAAAINARNAGGKR